VIGAGPIPPNPSELIMDSKMDELFTYLRANFDIIIIDSAPVGLVSDSKILSRFVDATLYVVRQRYTVKKQVSYIDELYLNKALPNMGLIINDVKTGGNNSYYGYGYGYGFGYGYNYHYSYGYGETEKKGLIGKVKDMVGL
jgi:Mrp family chromosome partitioning ATPase